MRAIVHVNKFYDWQPVPAGVEPTPQDIASGRVRPDAGGRWLMRVTIDRPSTTEVMISEGGVAAQFLQDHLNGNAFHDRKTAAAAWIAQKELPHHAHPSWINKIEVSDSAPGPEDEAHFRRMFAPHVGTYGTGRTGVTPEAHDELLHAYLAPVPDEAHVAHLHKHFRVKGA